MVTPRSSLSRRDVHAHIQDGRQLRLHMAFLSASPPSARSVLGRDELEQGLRNEPPKEIGQVHEVRKRRNLLSRIKIDAKSNIMAYTGGSLNSLEDLSFLHSRFTAVCS
jgi:hypothetical protein